MSTTKQNLLIEIGTEELPPKSLHKLAEIFAENLKQKLITAELNFTAIKSYATPRRLAVFVEQLDSQQTDRLVEKRGPALHAAFDVDNKPTKALEGFARSCNIDIAQLEKLETKQGRWMICRYMEKGKAIAELLPLFVNQALSELPIPKPMRWGAGDTQFVRPVHWVVMLYGKEIIAGEILGIDSGRKTYGHRFHHPDAIVLPDADSYQKLLKEPGHVIVDFEERKKIIREQVENIAKQQNCSVIIPEALLDEVTSIVERPIALLIDFDPVFLNVPREALISAMQEHQRCFALENGKGELLPYFITISNIESKNPQEVIRGNERVMRARLSDAKFFYETDCKETLESRLENLKNVVFQAKLGSLYDKSLRIVALAKHIAQLINIDSTITERAALLCKTDLLTNMVNEFPELQGTMGCYYAKHDKEKDTTAVAIHEHYQPRFAGDELPNSLIGCTVALADRIDTLVGIFGINQAPTGDKDPFGLRRAALGIIRILVEKKLNIDLQHLFNTANNNYGATLPAREANHQALQFILDRLPAWYNEQNIATDTLQAVLTAQQNNNLLDIQQRVLAIQAFRQLPQALSLAAANKRVKNLLSKSAQSTSDKKSINPSLFNTDEEKTLYNALESAQKKIQSAIQDKQYTALLAELANLQTPVDHFFDKVLVMDEDEKLRDNRLALLAALRQLFLTVADISLLQD